MFRLHSIAGRILITKTVGFTIGLLVFFLLPNLGIAHELEFRFGLVIFYTLLGVMIGLVGVLTVHPLGFPLRWWMRGAVMGSIFHLLLVLVAYDAVLAMVSNPIFGVLAVHSPYWIIIDGAVIGLLLSFLGTKVAGEGNLPIR